MRTLAKCGIIYLIGMSSVPVVAGIKPDAAATKILVVRGEGEYPPYEMTLNGSLVGIHMDTVRAVGRKLGISVEIQSVPWKRAQMMVEAGEADAITFLGKTPERMHWAIFEEGNVLSSTQNVFVHRREGNGEVKCGRHLSDYRTLTIGTLNGYSYGDPFDGAAFLTKDSAATTEDVLLKKLVTKRVDVAIANAAHVKAIAKSLKLEQQLTVCPAILPPVPSYLAFSKAKKLDELARKFSGAMATFVQSHDYRQLYRKYEVE